MTAIDAGHQSADRSAMPGDVTDAERRRADAVAMRAWARSVSRNRPELSPAPLLSDAERAEVAAKVARIRADAEQARAAREPGWWMRAARAAEARSQGGR